MSDRVASHRGGDFVLMGLRIAVLACGVGLLGVVGHAVWKVIGA